MSQVREPVLGSQSALLPHESPILWPHAAAKVNNAASASARQSGRDESW